MAELASQQDVAGPPRSPLRRREFRLYFIGNMASNVGNWVSHVALAVYMLNLTRSSFWVGLTAMGLFLPVIAFALPVGVLADRTDRLRLLRAAQLVMGVLGAALTVLAATGNANRYAVVAISFGFGAGVAIAIPTMQSLVPHLVPAEELADAIRLNALTFNVARVVGPITATAVLATVGPVWAFAANTVSYFVLVAALTLIRRPPFPRAATGEPGPVREGIAYAWRHLRTRYMLLAIVAIGVSLDPILTLSPALARELGHAASGAGWIVACWGGGAVAMLVLGTRLIRIATEHGLGWVGLVALAAGVLGVGASPAIGTTLPAAFLAGVGYIVATMAFTTSIQRDVPESLRGRVSALWTLAFLGPRAVAAVIGGALADALGARPATMMFASVAIAAAVMLRKVETTTAEPVPPPT